MPKTTHTEMVSNGVKCIIDIRVYYLLDELMTPISLCKPEARITALRLATWPGESAMGHEWDRQATKKSL